MIGNKTMVRQQQETDFKQYQTDNVMIYAHFDSIMAKNRFFMVIRYIFRMQ